MKFEDIPIVPKPKPGEKLFRSNLPDWQNNSWLAPWAPWWVHAHGFRLVARQSAERMAETASEQDFVVYPIVFNYRHYLELTLKHLILAAGLLLDQARPPKLFETHNLKQLWAWCQPLLEDARAGLGGTAGASELAAIGEAIDELTSVDAGSYAFRYPVDRRGAPSLPARLQYLNVRHFSDQMERIADCLDGCLTGIDVALDLKAESHELEAEMEADYRAEMEADYRAEMEADYRAEMEAEGDYYEP